MLTQTESGDYAIAVNQHLQRAKTVVLIAIVVITVTVGWWLSGKPFLTDWLYSARFWFWYGLLTISPLLLIFLLKQKRVVLSFVDRAVYILSPFGRKRLMDFDEIGAIKPYTDSLGGTYFALFGCNNLYQRNPPFTSHQLAPPADFCSAYWPRPPFAIFAKGRTSPFFSQDFWPLNYSARRCRI